MSAERALHAGAMEASGKPLLIRVTGSVPLGTGRGPRSFAKKGGSNPVGDAGPEIRNGLGAFLCSPLPNAGSIELLLSRTRDSRYTVLEVGAEGAE